MSFINDLSNAAEKAITKKVIENKMNAFIKELKENTDTTKKVSIDIETKMEESTGVIAEIIDDTAKVFFHIFRGVQDTMITSIEDNADTLTQLISDNKDEIVEIMTAVKTIVNRQSNKENIRYLGKQVTGDVTKYLNEDATDFADYISDVKVQPKVKELMELWNVQHKYYLRDDDEQLYQVDKETYEKTKRLARQISQPWYETKTTMKTYQSFKSEFDESIKTGRDGNRYNKYKDM